MENAPNQPTSNRTALQKGLDRVAAIREKLQAEEKGRVTVANPSVSPSQPQTQSFPKPPTEVDQEELVPDPKNPNEWIMRKYL